MNSGSYLKDLFESKTFPTDISLEWLIGLMSKLKSKYAVKTALYPSVAEFNGRGYLG